MTTTTPTGAGATPEPVWRPPTRARRIGAWFNRRPVALTTAVATATAWSLLVYGIPITSQATALLFFALIAGPVVASTLVLPHARRRWWRAVAVPLLVFTTTPASLVPVTITALAWYGYRTGYADAPWARTGKEG